MRGSFSIFLIVGLLVAGAALADKPTFQDLQDAVSADPKSAEAQRRLGVAYITLRRPGDALRHLNIAVELAPDDPECRLGLGRAYSAMGRLDQARAAYEKVLVLDPGHSKALNNLANIALRSGEEFEAIELYAKAVAADPKYLMAYYRMAQAQQIKGLTDDAYTAYSHVLELEPKSSRDHSAMRETLYQVASIELSRGNLARAETLLSRLIEREPAHQSAYYLLTQVLTRAERPEEAQAALDKHMQLLAKRRPTARPR